LELLATPENLVELLKELNGGFERFESKRRRIQKENGAYSGWLAMENLLVYSELNIVAVPRLGAWGCQSVRSSTSAYDGSTQRASTLDRSAKRKKTKKIQPIETQAKKFKKKEEGREKRGRVGRAAREKKHNPDLSQNLKIKLHL
jgi:hypothetical protein